MSAIRVGDKLRIVGVVEEALGCLRISCRKFQFHHGRLADRDSVREIRCADISVVIRVVFWCGRELAGMFDAHAPETGLARDDDVGKLRGDVRAGSVTDDPQRFVSNHGYIAESVWVALVDHMG